ncbi:MAG: hypothetical protein ACI4PD_04150 [Butyricicoccus sp.]
MITAGRTPFENRAIYICIDEVGAYGELKGRLASAYLPEPVRFHTAGELMYLADGLLDETGVAPRYEERRCFPSIGPPAHSEQKIGRAPRSIRFEEGACATFEVRVYFRRNATWQGEARWIEQGEHEMFRSVMELLHMISDAVTLGGELPKLAAN